MNWSAKGGARSSLHYGGEGVLIHPPHQGVCRRHGTEEQHLDSQLNRLHTELREECYQPRPVRQVQIPKAGKPGEFRTLGIPTIYDRVCQQALLNRLEPIFEPVFDEANFGYRRGRSTKDALRKVWKEIQDEGREWIVDADLRD